MTSAMAAATSEGSAGSRPGRGAGAAGRSARTTATTTRRPSTTGRSAAGGTSSTSAAPPSDPDESGREGDPRHAPVHEAGPGVAEQRRARAEDALPLVGPERQRGRQAGGEQRRQGDEPTPAGDGVHRPGDERGEDEERERGEGDVQARGRLPA